MSTGTEKLEPYEVDVQSADGINVGDLVRVKSDVVARWRVAGIDAAAIDRMAIPGRVVRIVKHRADIWISLLVDNGHSREWRSPGQLEVVK